MHGELVHGDVRPVQRRCLHGERPHRDRCDAAGADRGRDLDDAPVRQVVDQAPVRHVRVDLALGAGDQRVDDLRGVLRGALLELHGSAGRQVALGGLELGDVVLGDADVLERTQAEPVDLLRRAEEPRQVLGGVLARLGRVGADPLEHLDPHPALELRVLPDALAEPRVQVLALVRPLEQPRLVVDACCAEPGLLDVEAEESGEVVRGPVDAVAEPERRDVRRDGVRPPDVHRHRVRVVEQDRVRGDLAHVRGQLGEEREGAEGTEDAADPRRVTDGLVQPVPLRDLEVGPGRGDPADLHHVDDEVRVGEGATSVGRRREGDRPAEALAHLAGGGLGDGEATLVDVEQPEVQLGEVVVPEEVGEQLSREDDAPGADEHDAGHGKPFVRGTAEGRRSGPPGGWQRARRGGRSRVPTRAPAASGCAASTGFAGRAPR